MTKIVLNRINPIDFETKIQGQSTQLFVLKNKNGLEAAITNYGLRLVTLKVPDNKGDFDDIVLGFNTLKTYRTAKGKYFGAIIGQYSNRIANGKFSIDDQDYILDVNNKTNHIHGGKLGYNDVAWNANQINNNEIEFSREFIDGQNGYPGNVKVTVNYILSEENELKIYYKAITDKPTIINLSHHSFFNLKGEGNGLVDDHSVYINANSYTPINKNMIPDEGVKMVSNTPFDFREPKLIAKDLNNQNEQLKQAKGYDHNFVLNNAPKNYEGLIFAARVKEPSSGRIMEVYTNEPGMQFYTGNFLDGSLKGKRDEYYSSRSGFCLETQHFPNSPNNPEFPSVILRPDEEYNSICVYKFLTKN